MTQIEAQLWHAEGFVEPPGEDELIYDDGVPMESARHRQQMHLLIDISSHHYRQRDDVYVGGNMFLYFSETQTKQNDFRGPDFFAVFGTTKRDRKAWIAWAEDGKLPDLIIEFLSQSTAHIDRGPKKRLYEKVLRIPEYYLYDPWTQELEGFQLSASSYSTLPQSTDGRIESGLLGLKLGIWEGDYQDTVAPWLRFFTTEGELVPTWAEAEAQRADTEAQRVKTLAEQLAAYEEKFGPLEPSST